MTHTFIPSANQLVCQTERFTTDKWNVCRQAFHCISDDSLLLSKDGTPCLQLLQWELHLVWTVIYSFSRKWHMILEPASSYSNAIFLLPHTWHETYFQVKTNRSSEPCFCAVPRNVLCSGEVIWMAIETEITNKLPKACNILWCAVSLQCRDLVVSHL